MFPAPYLPMTVLPGFWSCHGDQHEVQLWVVWFDPPFFVFSVPTPYTESVEIVEPFVSSDTVFVLVGLVQQVQVLE